MNVIDIDIGKLIPYEKNPRINKNSVNYVAESIKQFGFKVPIVIDKNYCIVAGHTRLLASKKLKLDKVPCIIADDLTEQQIKAFRLADNKVSEFSEWDFDILKDEIDKILDIDMSLFGFDFLEDEKSIDDENENDTEHHRMNTIKQYNLDLYDSEKTCGKYNMPIIEAEIYIPDRLIGFNYMMTSKEKNCGIHCYVDDYQFERLWNTPKLYIDKILEYQCFLSPDFSLYLDMPMAMKIWNVYRSRLIGQYLQECGCIVIPTVSWAETETFEFCFDGLPKNSTVSVSTIGVKKDEHSMLIWKQGMDEMIKRISPKQILLYGGKVDYDYKNIEIYEFKNEVTERMIK